ncbi:putative 3-methyladenine DNA glycosylase [Planomonospora parontospora subsp. parontospora]|uniref:Putative 3-methyladenine DNA glycosylase n=2 Tax=Planomonospora parontospora TaxID=58119 RepID=A0AA37BMA8_9ACTN|nr:DNA-3-methyladenine glycosylase [Planomonospora parontospora]GGK91856.1 putative 3-methyladenine DNA glycosylase [Planomonospora parontospora]GII11217.1 putative 3-methyladenine DNA glycosylase [Planomonospora parontospora subsp. parontospora]
MGDRRLTAPGGADGSGDHPLAGTAAGRTDGPGGPDGSGAPASDAPGGHPLARTAPLGRDFFDRPAHEVAPDLLGRVLVHGPVALRLTEVEAYGLPGQDPAAHTYRGLTPRNAVMFGPPGHLYVYFTYGMHFCANLVCLPEGMGSGVLLRAGEVIDGTGEALARRGAGRAVSGRDLARGPARLAMALGFGREHNGLDACSAGPPGPSGRLAVLEGDPPGPGLVRSGPRTGVSSGKETPWRFWIDGDATVSPYRVHVPRRPRGTADPAGNGPR